MISIETVFAPIIGEIVWGVQQGIESFLTMEFGEPHLRVRETIPTAVSPLLHRRNVYIVGQWRLWLLYCEWAINTQSLTVTSADWKNNTLVSEAIFILNGQRLINTSLDTARRLARFDFEADTTITVTPMAEEIDNDLWGFYVFDGPVYSYSNRGTIYIEERDKRNQD